jgi:hypothetical protein
VKQAELNFLRLLPPMKLEAKQHILVQHWLMVAQQLAVDESKGEAALAAGGPAMPKAMTESQAQRSGGR